MIVTLPGVSLNWLMKQHRDQFYAQDWYAREPFACKPWRGMFEVPDPRGAPSALPAVVLAKAYLDGALSVLNDHFMWTSDVDHNGHQVYIGMAGEYPGIQVHRHLIPDERWIA